MNCVELSPSKIDVTERAVLSFIRGHLTYDGYVLEKTSATLETFLPKHFRRTLKMWAPALDWCLLAAGGIDVLVSFESELEDQYAGTLIAQEAGVDVFSFSGNPYNDEVTRIIATNSGLKDQMLKLLRDYAK